MRPAVPVLDPALASRLAGIIGDGLRREYPNKIAHLLLSDADVAPPRQLAPIFHGCFDWHSAVHSHWALVRLRREAAPEVAIRIAAWLDASFTDAGVAGELAYLAPRPAFEVPYGMAWLLTLVGELRAGAREPAEAAWLERLGPLEAAARDRIAAWVGRLPRPVRSGEHSGSAFAMGLALDWARLSGDGGLEGAIAARARQFHGDDRDAPLHREPSGWDFVSPSLAEADLMSRLLGPAEMAAWLDRFAPRLGRGERLAPVPSSDPADGKLSHLDGLSLSRAWMLAAIAAALPAADERCAPLAAMAESHAAAGLSAIDASLYAGAHWLPSYAVYCLTGRLRPLP
jgi:DUF2891 family protein